jgi:hypothetical protein
VLVFSVLGLQMGNNGVSVELLHEP